MPNFRRGAGAIKEAAEQGTTQSKFRSFAPTITWSGDEMSKYVLILTPIDEVAAVSLHSWIPVGEVKGKGRGKYRFEDFISRKDPSIGEDFDRLEDELERNPQTRVFGVGVELEPTFETIKGRKKPTGFTASTRSYTKRTNDGEEEVEVAKIGLIVQSSKLMWTPLNSVDSAQGPLEYLPLQITREGTDQNTDYTIIPFDGLEVDLLPIVENLEGLSYLSDQQEDILAEIAALDDDEFDLRAAQVIARTLLETRLEELADSERYDELTSNIKYLPQPFTNGEPKFYGNGGPKASEDDDDDAAEEEAPKPKPRPKRTRTPRKSQKEASKKKVEASEPEPEEPDEAPEAEAEVEEKPKKGSSKKTAQRSRFDELRASMAAKQAEKAEA